MVPDEQEEKDRRNVPEEKDEIAARVGEPGRARHDSRELRKLGVRLEEFVSERVEARVDDLLYRGKIDVGVVGREVVAVNGD
jgi:hypothetical protein